MRYKVKTQTTEAYRRVLGELQGQPGVKVVTTVPRRHVVAIEGLPKVVRTRLHSLGAEITEDLPYDLERSD